jgi:hypothetical protein
MRSPEQDLALLESAALRSESLEHIAEKSFDDTYAIAERSGSVAGVTTTPEFHRWMAARADTDAAWGRWAECMHAAEGARGTNG